jgi:hypothetical protein
VLGEDDPGQVADRTHTGVGKGQFPRVRLGIGHHLGNVLYRYGGMHRQDIGGEHHHGDRSEVLFHVVGELAEEVGRRGHGAHVGDQHGMAVLVGLGHKVGPDVSGGSHLVLDHDRLTDGLGKMRSDQAGKDV